MKKNLSIKGIKFLSKNEQKIIQGGYDPVTPDGFTCAHAYLYCDAVAPNDYELFNGCLTFLSC